MDYYIGIFFVIFLGHCHLGYAGLTDIEHVDWQTQQNTRDVNNLVYDCRKEASEWLSGVNQFGLWENLTSSSLYSERAKSRKAEGPRIVFLPSIHDALYGIDSNTHINRLNEILCELKAGEIRSHRALRNRLDVLGSWTIPPKPNLKDAPPVGTIWGSVELKSKGFWPQLIGYIDYCFPGEQKTQKTPNAIQSRRVIVVCPYDGESGASFAHFRNLAWDANLPVIGFRVPVDIKDAELTKLWPQLVAAALPEIQQLARDNYFTVEAVTVVGYCAGADRAKKLVCEWKDLIDSGVLINLHLVDDLVDNNPHVNWLRINVVGEGARIYPDVSDYRTLNPRDASSLWVSPDFRNQELFASRWNYLDTREQQLMAQVFINALPKNARIASSFPDVTLPMPNWAPEGYVPLSVKDCGSIQWLIQAVNATNFQAVPLVDSYRTRAVYLCPPVSPHGIVVCIPSDETLADDVWLLELCWWRSKGWLPIIAPAATPETLAGISDWIEGQANWKILPRYLVLYEDIHQKPEMRAAGAVWQQALTLVSAERFRALGWVSADPTLYANPELLANWHGPVPGGNTQPSMPFELWPTDGVIRPENKLGHKPGTAGKPVVVVPLDEPAHLLPNPNAARLALSRVFRRDAREWHEFTTASTINRVTAAQGLPLVSPPSPALAVLTAEP